MACWHEYNWHYYPETRIPGKIAYVESGQGSGSNYAMNYHVVEDNKVGKILAMDYLWILARSSDDWSDPAFDADEDGVPDFARHGGRMNVLFRGGEVRLMKLDDINPADVKHETGYWLP